MFNLIAPRDLAPIPAIAAAAFVVLAVFAWTERTVLVDPDHMSVPYWPWKLWQIGPLLMGIGGAWWVWSSTRRVPWVRSLALGILALAVLFNGYSNLFGDHWGEVWRTINPLFIGCTSIAAVTLWRWGSHCWASGSGGLGGAWRSPVRQRILRRLRRPLAGAESGANAHLPGPGGGCRPGQRGHIRNWRLTGWRPAALPRRQRPRHSGGRGQAHSPVAPAMSRCLNIQAVAAMKRVV